MKNNRIMGLALAAGMMLAAITPVHAEKYEYTDWKATFTGEEIESNITTTDFSGVQPGDTVTMKVTVKNDSEKETYWYMNNEVLATLEETDGTSATGGAYQYELKYNEENLYTNMSVGGTNSETAVEALEGLKNATVSSEDYFYFATMKPGETGTVELTVTLDGSTQNNDYMLTLGRLKLAFAVEEKVVDEKEVPVPPDPIHKTVIVNTGDSTNISKWAFASAASGIALAGMGIYFAKKDRKEEEEA